MAGSQVRKLNRRDRSTAKKKALPKDPVNSRSVAQGYPQKLGGSSFGGAVPAKRVGARTKRKVAKKK